MTYEMLITLSYAETINNLQKISSIMLLAINWTSLGLSRSLSTRRLTARPAESEVPGAPINNYQVKKIDWQIPSASLSYYRFNKLPT
jgi:hypothetical protein